MKLFFNYKLFRSLWLSAGGLCLLAFVMVRAQERLTNEDVVSMLRSGMSAELVIAKIKSSKCNFDTEVETLKMLSRTGVPESVLLVMISVDKSPSNPQLANIQNVDNKSLPKDLNSLLGKRSVYVDADNVTERAIIEREFKKYSYFQVTQDAINAELIISYYSWEQETPHTPAVINNVRTEVWRNIWTGNLSVTLNGGIQGDRTAVYAIQKVKYFLWDENPAESSAKQFIRDLMKAAALRSKK